MKYILRSEETILFLASLVAFHYLNFSWTWYFVFILAPDLSMLGYLVNPKLGAFAYNFIHHKGLGVLVLLAGILFHSIELQFSGLILFSHSSLDRIFGYGLKFTDSFHNTHLGIIGKNQIK